ncbi:DUF342 domain-containing protein [Oligoflexus tunisiensis]|uniref:DUF342 domain-containing protein n=1 Tax=Oligoflexus tunisiensis TaxID=708132 RepID=UPI00114CA55E|nr:FapA family protein [Oligoflexus tunisiensis]
MFGSPKIQVTYNARLRRARAQFKAVECFKSRKPPASALRSIEIRFEEEKLEGHIETYAIFGKRLEELWSTIRSLEDSLDPEMLVKITIGQGARLYPEISLTPDPKGGSLALLKSSFTERKILTVPFNTFLFNILQKLQELHIEGKPDRAQLRFLHLLLQKGQRLENMALRFQPRREQFEGRLFGVKFDSTLRYATLHIFDPRCLGSSEQRAELLKQATIELNRLNTGKIKLNLLKEHSLEKLESLAHKMQALGLNLPYDLLIAYDKTLQLNPNHLVASKSKAQHEQADLPHWKMRLGALTQKAQNEFFTIGTRNKDMLAVITAVNKPALDKVKDHIDLEWLSMELQKQGIVFGYDDFLEPLWQAIQLDSPLVGMRVAKGLPPEPGEKLDLHWTHDDDKGEDHQQLNMRENQNRQLVRTGDRVAEIRFTDGTPGKTVLGADCYAQGSAVIAGIAAGRGIEVKDDSVFYATCDGLLRMDSNVLLCENAYIHKGSINLKSGDLRFEGTVVVQGDIESGASVEVQGNLIVEGMISPSKVHCTGDLDVKGGIITGPEGFIHTGGNCRCNYIENSMLQVKGNLTVQKSILNSTVMAHGTIVILDEGKGVIAGGLLSSWSAIRTAHLGMEQGQPTECRLGSNLSSEKRLHTLRQRLKRLQVHHEKLNVSLKGIDRKDQQDQARLLREKSQRLEKIIHRLVSWRDLQEKKVQWNHSATLIVTGILNQDVALFVTGQRVQIQNNIRGVLVPGVPYHGTQLVDLKELSGYVAATPGAIVASGKASRM